MRLNLILVALLGAVIVYALNVQRRLQAAQMRGDMYRDISARLDRRIAELNGQ
jgi:hypothetical protein